MVNLILQTNAQGKNNMNCIHLNNNECAIASWIANDKRSPTPEDCRACQRCEHPMDINEVTNAVAGIEPSNHGIGTSLHNTITWFVPVPKDCNCINRVQVMNHWGYDRCKEEFRVILGWLRDSAHEQGYPYSEYIIGAVLRRIIEAHKPVEKPLENKLRGE